MVSGLGPVELSILPELMETGILAAPFPEEIAAVKRLFNWGILTLAENGRFGVARDNIPRSFFMPAKMKHPGCGRCWDPISNTAGNCHFGRAPIERESEDKEESPMSKGIFFTTGGKVFKVTSTDAKKALKAVIKGDVPTLDPTDEIAPVIDLEKIDVETATKLYMKIELGGE